MRADFFFFLDRLCPSSDESEVEDGFSEEEEDIEDVESDEDELDVVELDESEDLEESEDEFEEVDADLFLFHLECFLAAGFLFLDSLFLSLPRCFPLYSLTPLSIPLLYLLK